MTEAPDWGSPRVGHWESLNLRKLRSSSPVQPWHWPCSGLTLHCNYPHSAWLSLLWEHYYNLQSQSGPHQQLPAFILSFVSWFVEPQVVGIVLLEIIPDTREWWVISPGYVGSEGQQRVRYSHLIYLSYIAGVATPTPHHTTPHHTTPHHTTVLQLNLDDLAK